MPTKITQEEKELLDSYEQEEWVSVLSAGVLSAGEHTKYKAAVKATFRKDKRVNIRVSGKDLEMLQERALIEGIPYQTLMSSILHKYVYGNLVDKT